MAAIDENDTATLSGTIVDPGTLDALTLEVDWGDGQIEPFIYPAGTTTFSETHQYLDDPADEAPQYTIGLTITDDDTGSSIAAAAVTVNNVSPGVDIKGVPAQPTEGTPIVLSTPVFDPGSLDTHDISWLARKDGVEFASGDAPFFTFTPDDNGTYEVTLRVTDDDGGVGADSASIEVADVAPELQLISAATVTEGSLYELTIADLTDVGDDHAVMIVVSWGDGSELVMFDPRDEPLPHVLTHEYDDGPDVRRITTHVIDEDGAHEAGWLDITIDNVPPSALAINGGQVVEGSDGQVELIVLASADPSDADTLAGFTYGFDFNNDGDFDDPGEIDPVDPSSTATGAIVPGVYLVDEPGATIRMVARDKDGGQSVYWTTIPVVNAAPSLELGPAASAFRGEPFSLTRSIVDPGNDANWTISVWYGDGGLHGTDPADRIFSRAEREFTLSHIYSTAGIYAITVEVADGDGGVAVDTAEVTVVADTLRVVDVTPVAGGVQVRFSRAIDPSVLNLYDGLDESEDLPDLTLIGETVGPIGGSIILDAAANTLTFLKTGSVLPGDTYTLTLVSGVDGLRDTAGEPLDGDGDQNSGGDYVTTFIVNGVSRRVISIPDFARGAGQDVSVPVGSAGLPIHVDRADGIYSVDFDIEYDPTLLEVTGTSLAEGLPDDWVVVDNLAAPGLTRVTLFGITPLSGDDVHLISLDARVPDTAAYGSSQAVRVANPRINEGSIPARADWALHKAVYLADVDGNGIYTGFDAAMISRVVVDLDTGYDAHDWTDPVVIGDGSGNGTLSGLDASYVAQKAVRLPRPQIPDLPAVSPPPVAPGIDPELSIPDNLPGARGKSVAVDVSIDVGLAENVYSATFDVAFDPSVLQIADENVTLGEFWSDGWALIANVDESEPGLLSVAMWNSDGVPSAPGAGSIVRMQVAVAEDAPAGGAMLDVEPVDPNEGDLLWTEDDGSILIENPGVKARHVFYNNSRWDKLLEGGNDGAAIATDKVALRPGGEASFANYTSYSRGINGVMVDLDSLSGTPTEDDFTFRVGNSPDVENWGDAPAHESFDFQLGQGTDGSDRVVVTWADRAIVGKWLQVTVAANLLTGLTFDDVFYFGNAVGESGDYPGRALVNATDEIAARSNQHGSNDQSAIDDLYDFNRDGLVNATDQIIVRSNHTNPFSVLRLLTIPSQGNGGAAPVPPSAADEIRPNEIAVQDAALTQYALEAASTWSGESQPDVDDSPTQSVVDKLLASYW